MICWNIGISAPLSICKSIFNISNKIVFKTYTITKFVVVFIKIQIVCFLKRFATVRKQTPFGLNGFHAFILVALKVLLWLGLKRLKNNEINLAVNKGLYHYTFYQYAKSENNIVLNTMSIILHSLQNYSQHFQF